MKYNLLELTQTVLSSMDSDEINSISDSPESLQVVQVIKTVYDDIVSRGDLTSNKMLFTLDASIDVTKPTLMTKPSNVDRIEWLRYNVVEQYDTDPSWRDLTYMPMDQYIMYTQQYSLTDPDVSSFTQMSNGFNFTFHYKTDTSPSFYTSIEDNIILMDSYDKLVDTTLQSSKTLAYGQLVTNFSEEDTFTPNLNPQQFALLLNEAKALAWIELKQSPHPKAEVTARRNWRHLQKTRTTTPDGKTGNNAHPFDKLPNYGRR